jgi:hypothetical protein
VKVRLLFPDRDAAWDWALATSGLRKSGEARGYHDRPVSEWSALPRNARELCDDLQLETLFEALSGGDDCIYLIARRELLNATRNTTATIRHRRRIVRDTIANPDLVRSLYVTASNALRESGKPHLDQAIADHPERAIAWAAEVLAVLVPQMERLAEIARIAGAMFEAPGLRPLLTMLRAGVTPEFLESLPAFASALQARGGDIMSARLGAGNLGRDYVPHRPLAKNRRRPAWLHKLGGGPASYGFSVSPADETALTALRQLRNRGLSATARAATQAATDLRGFFAALRVELAFYVGSLNLHERLSAKGEPIGFPVPLPRGGAILLCAGLYDPCLSLRRQQRVVGNDLRGRPAQLIIITGANEGGKSTFLRSVGVAQLMMQAGLFVAAKHFCSSLSPALFTHFRREEDRWMRRGKLEEELSRMSDIVAAVSPGAIILLNESFASTYEQEGSEIARQATKALAEKAVRMLFVTHLFEFARRGREAVPDAFFLRAERDEAGRRTFRLTKGEPQSTAFAADLYSQLFGEPLPGSQGPPA